MEGVAYSLRESPPIIRELGVPIKEIRLSGGGAKSPLWNRSSRIRLANRPVQSMRNKGSVWSGLASGSG